MARIFTWDAWDFDCNGEAYVIAKSECPKREDVPDYICRNDHIHSECKPEMVMQEGWCKFQCRTDWENGDGELRCGYVVTQHGADTKRLDGRRKPGWFPVWIVRKGEWY